MNLVKKFGVLVNNLAVSQLTYELINKANGIIAEEPLCDIILFYANHYRPCGLANCAIMEISEAYGYDGCMIATDLETANYLLGFPTTDKQKYLYVWDLEWIRPPIKPFNSMQKIYGNPDLKLIARSDEHKAVIEDCWNRPVSHVIKDFNLQQFVTESHNLLQ